MNQPNAENKTVLVFAPHPDDAELAMGATICKLINEGWEVVIADLTNGEPTPAGSVEIRQTESQKASEILGVKRRMCLGLPNRWIEETLEARRIVAETIRDVRPRWVFINYPEDAHPDHIRASHLIMDGRFTAKLTKTDMKGEPFYPEKVIYYYASHLRIHPQPSFVVDVSDYWQQKLDAAKAYKSQFWDNQSDPDRKGWILEHITTLGKYFGNRIGVDYGEAFWCHELVGLRALGDLT